MASNGKSKSPAKTKKEDQLVAFLDILGFREMVATRGNVGKIKKIFNTIERWGENLNKGYSLKDDSDKMSFYLMSDSIVVNIRAGAPKALKRLIEVCKDLQSQLYSFDPPVLIRGAFAKGEYRVDDRVAFGKALVDAYSYQENYNRYPRVIISGELVKEECDRGQFTLDEAEELLIIEDEDHYRYINSFKCLFPNGKKGDEADRFSKFVEEQISKYGPLDVRKKYIWLRDNYKKGESNRRHCQTGRN